MLPDYLKDRLTDQSPSLESATASYQTDFYELEENFQLLVRSHLRSMPAREFNVFPNNWLLVFSEPSSFGLGLRRFGKKIVIPKDHAVFIPAYNLVEWDLPEGELNWYAFRSEAVHFSLPKKAYCFRYDSKLRIQSLQDVLRMFSNGVDGFAVDKQETHSRLAQETKGLVDRFFLADKSIATLADELGISHSVMTHTFKNCFGLSPIAYRNLLRVFHSLRLMMLDKKDATRSCFESGFNDYSRFTRNFSGTMSAPPSKFTT